MKVLMITGDRRIFSPGTGAYGRFELQSSAVENLRAVYWGKGSVFAPLFVRGEYDVVTVQDPFWRGLVGLFLARRLRTRFNVQLHTDLSAHSVERRMLANFVLHRADSVRVVSQKIKEQMENWGVRARMDILPVFIDTAKFAGIVHKPHKTANILWIGRFEDEKDPLFAIEVLKNVLKSVPAVTMTMIGEGSLKKETIRRAGTLPVSTPGWQNPVSFLETADVVLSTSRHESFGASIIEALAAGVPVVAPDVGVAKEAGATVMPREMLAEEIVRTLQSGRHGSLGLSLPSAKEWARLWRNNLEEY